MTPAQVAHIRAKHGNEDPSTPSWADQRKPSWLRPRNVAAAVFVILCALGVLRAACEDYVVPQQQIAVPRGGVR